MKPTDIADVTGAIYTYLLNVHGTADNWTGLFNPGERIRLRIINASAMSIFNVRVPGLPMTVVQADGLNVQPVETDELQIGTAETYDVVVQPAETIPYALIAKSNDRSGLVRGTLAPQLGMAAPIPALRQRPTLTMKDMAMDHGAIKDGAMDHGQMKHEQMDHSKMGHGAEQAPAPQAHNHKPGPGVVGLAENPVSRLGERPLGLEDVAHRVLVYADLKSLLPNPDTRAPERVLELHLTSNMERYMWSFDGPTPA